MDNLEIKKIWDEAKSYLEKKLKVEYLPWMELCYPISYTNGVFSTITDKGLILNDIRKNYFEDITDAIKQVTGNDVEFQITMDKEAVAKIEKEIKKIEKKYAKITASDKPIDKIPNIQIKNTDLNLKYKFEHFVVGESNRNAHAIAKMVAEAPAERFNPLFIYGGSGLGKTHLMQAIGWHVHTSKKVKYIQTQEYVRECIENMRGKDKTEAMIKFRQKFRNIDLLLLDDIQFIESKTKCMEELFDTFETLMKMKKQIVITSDRLPKDIPTLPDRMRTRFEMGIVVDIQPPSYETRMAILEKWSKDAMIDFPKDAIGFVANNFTNNVRELEGAFNKVSAFSEIEKTPITLEFVQKVLKSETVARKITIENIAQTIAEAYNITVKDLKSPSRSNHISLPRKYVVYLAREMTQMSYQEIADFLEKKHTTMLYSYEKTVEEADRNSKTKETIRELKQAVKCNAV